MIRSDDRGVFDVSVADRQCDVVSAAADHYKRAKRDRSDRNRDFSNLFFIKFSFEQAGKLRGIVRYYTPFRGQSQVYKNNAVKRYSGRFLPRFPILLLRRTVL